MKNLFYLITFLVLFSCRENPASSKDNASEEKPTTVAGSHNNSQDGVRDIQSIDDIRKEYSYITSEIEGGSMDSVSVNYNCRDEKMGDITFFTEEGELRLIRHTYNEYSHFSGTDEYFLKDGDLFFVFQDHLSWSFVDQNETKEDIAEQRIYIIDNNPVMCLQKEFTTLSDAENPPESNRVSNTEIECSSLEPILEDFELLFRLRNQEEDLDCLKD